LDHASLDQSEPEQRLATDVGSFRVEIDEPGVLDRLTLRAAPVRQPGPGEVLIAVETAALNFLDVMKAMGVYPGLEPGRVPLGHECAGRITEIGNDVPGFAVGD